MEPESVGNEGILLRLTSESSSVREDLDGHCLFAGQGQSMGGSSAPKSAEEMRAARLARLSGGAPPAKKQRSPQRSPQLAQLMDMGFPEDKAKNALEASGNNVEQAMEMLL